MKLCKDCKHYEERASEYGGKLIHVCTSSLGTALRDTDMVTGEVPTYSWSCYKARYDDDLCASFARYYEPREPHTPQEEQR